MSGERRGAAAGSHACHRSSLCWLLLCSIPVAAGHIAGVHATVDRAGADVGAGAAILGLRRSRRLAVASCGSDFCDSAVAGMIDGHGCNATAGCPNVASGTTIRNVTFYGVTNDRRRRSENARVYGGAVSFAGQGRVEFATFQSNRVIAEVKVMTCLSDNIQICRIALLPSFRLTYIGCRLCVCTCLRCSWDAWATLDVVFSMYVGHARGSSCLSCFVSLHFYFYSF